MRNLLYSGVVVGLLSLIIFRLFLAGGHWVSLLNGAGLLLAWLSWMGALVTLPKGQRLYFLMGISSLIFFLLVIWLMAILCGWLVLDELWNDELLLVTLLISLPQPFYLSKAENWVKRGRAVTKSRERELKK